MKLRPLSTTAALTLISILAFALPGRPSRATSKPADIHSAHDHAAGGMSEAAMKREVEAYWAKHKRVGKSSPEGTPAATFTVQNFAFDADGNLNTQNDQVTIQVGQSVLWQWVNGMHTITNGTGQSDPNQGTLFNQPSDDIDTEFTFTFNTAGTYPFFCSPHELQNMRGTVVVEPGPTGVQPLPDNGARLGFTLGPTPNPTAAGIHFRFAVRTAGRARAEVFDVRGRRIASIVDRDLPVGLFAGSWDGRSRDGLTGPGTYYLRLKLPGYAKGRSFVIAR
jgi:plastocyanin